MRKVAVMFLLSVVCLRAWGLGEFNFHHLSTDDGLSNNNVKAVLKDKYGQLWIGTNSGLNRYDGYSFKKYVILGNDGNTIDDIWKIQEDADANIWVSSYSTNIIYLRNKDCFSADTRAKLASYGIKTNGECLLHVDRNGNLWLINRGLIQYYDFGKRHLKCIKVPERVTQNVCSVTDSKDYLYLLSSKSRLYRIAKNRTELRCVPLPDSKTVQLDIVYADDYGGLWVSSSFRDILFRKNVIGHLWSSLPMPSKIETSTQGVISINDDHHGNIWVCTDHNGAFVYNHKTLQAVNLLNDPADETTIAGNNVSRIFSDNDGITWVGHNKMGISYTHPSFSYITNYSKGPVHDVSAITEDEQGRLWFGTDGDGLYMKDKNGDINKQNMIPNTSIVSINIDKWNRLWACTYIDGLYCISGNTVKHYTKKDGLADASVWNVVVDKYGRAWLMSYSGLQLLNPATGSIRTLVYSNHEPIKGISLYYDGKTNVYAGSVFGLCKVNIDNLHVNRILGNKHGTKFRHYKINTIFAASNGVLWLGHPQGATAWDRRTDSIYTLGIKDGLCNELVMGIGEDASGNIIVTTSNGITSYKVTRNKNQSLHFTARSFNKHDGLESTYCNKNAICLLRDGNMAIGNTDGYIVAGKQPIGKRDRRYSRVSILDLKIGNEVIDVDSAYDGRVILKKPMPITKVLNLEYDDRMIDIEFSTGNLLDARNIYYAYRIIGFGDQWEYIQQNHIALSSLPPGDYKLQLRACDSNGVWYDDVTELEINVSPPFYRSTVAIVLYVILVVLFLLAIIQMQRKIQDKKAADEKRKFAYEQEVQLNEKKTNFFINISHDLRTPLTMIITPLQTLLNEPLEDRIKTKLNIMYHNASHLLNLINELLDYRKLEVGSETMHYVGGDIISFVRDTTSPFYDFASERNVKFNVASDIPSLRMSYDSDKVQKILYNLISNAFKYTPDGGEVDLKIERDNNYIQIKIADTGIGISDEDKEHIFERFYRCKQDADKTGSGIGLFIVYEYALRHGGHVSVSDNRPKGTVFTVSLPIIEPKSSEYQFGKDKNAPFAPSEDVAIEADVAKPTLLYVDDNRDLCSFMKDSMEVEYNVLIAHDGREAIATLQDEDVAIVVSDVMMPVMDGEELCRRIKTTIEWSHIPVILLTAKTTDESRMAGLKLGADDYITKPFNLDMLKLRIRKFMEWAELSHKAFAEKMDVEPSDITITPLDEQLIQKALKIVEDNIGNAEFSVESLGDAVGMSRSHLYRKLMAVTGRGPAEFIRTIRLKRAKQLLEQSQMQVSEVAYAVGYNSPKRFSVAFRTEYGMSPSDVIKGSK